MKELVDSAVEFLVRYGYMTKRQAAKVSKFDDIALTSAVARFQRMDANVGILKEMTGEPLNPDGIIGPATSMAMKLPRCKMVDSDETAPALGSGGWKNCHGANGEHRAIVTVDESRMPSWWEPVLKTVLRNIQRSYAQIGMLFLFRDKSGRDIWTGEKISGPTNIDWMWERGDGWIGLAIVGNGSNQRCNSRIWAKFDTKYRPRNLIVDLTNLGRHELGHCMGLRHTRGGILNPSIISGLPIIWTPDDPSYKTLVRLHGGEPVEIPGDGKPKPPSDDKRPAPFEPLGESFELWDGTRARLYREFDR